MNSTDFLNLNGHKIIQNVKNSLPGNLTKALNVLTVKDNVLFTWDFQSHCVLTLNIKAARENCQNDGVICQKLLPLSSVIFSPEKIVANDSGTLLIVAGPNGVIVFKLPTRSPPYGAFSNNKELVYCQTYSLEERLLTCADGVEVLQVRFHPGSIKDNHILLLTSDNTLRLYLIEEEEAICLGVYLVGEKPMAKMPCSKMTFLGALGETAVDFDFGHPEIGNKKATVLDHIVKREDTVTSKPENPKRPLVKIHDPLNQTDAFIAVVQPDKGQHSEEPIEEEKYTNFKWPVYVLSGDFIINTINIPLYEKVECPVKGPLPLMPTSILQCDKRACSIICLNSSPQIICMGSTSGEILHGIVLPIEDDTIIEHSKPQVTEPTDNKADKEIYIFEAVDIELGLTTTLPQEEDGYSCPIFLHKDDSRCDRYFISHSAGVHTVSINCIEDIQNNSSENSSDVFSIPSTVDYLVCTKTNSTKHYNPVIGFADYYNPNAIIALLANGNLVTLALISASRLPKIEKLSLEVEDVGTSPIKEMLKIPFEQHIHNLLKKANSHPIMKLSRNEDHSLKECHELMHKTAQIFKEKFKYHTKAKEEIEKRATTLRMLKDNQLKELENMNKDKRGLQEEAESLAEKYEDIHEKQEVLLKRCAKILTILSMKTEILSDAEIEYLRELKNMREMLDRCDTSIEKLIAKKNYQESQMRNWKSQHQKKTASISETHKNTIKDSLMDSSAKINKMLEEIKAIKKHLHLK